MTTAAGDWFWWALAALLVGGLAPGLYFLVTWRPRRWRRGIVFDLRASVGSLVIVYLLAGVRAAVDAEAPSPGVGVLYLAVFALIDLHLWGRAIMWERLRRQRRQAVEVDLTSGDPVR